jgi:branched-chain amino acid aminotransferase
MSIKITKVKESKVGSIDFNNLPFGEICTDHMYVADYEDGKWKAGEIRPLTYFRTHPANLAWHYGQSIFEGMKASKHHDGTPLLFRVEQHARRMNASARRMCMPEIPEEMFIEAVTEMVRIEKNWIPPQEGSALYIRPFMFASDEFIGVRPSKNYKFVIFTCPVGPYYSQPVSLRAEDKYVRATPGGVGEAKTAGNYAASLYPAKVAKEKGYDQVMWMDPYEFKYIQEVGTMNIFFVIGKKVYTPELNGAILRGITRDTIITILKDEGYTVVEEQLSIDKVWDAYKKDKLKEVWGTGTAAVVSMVNKIAYEDKIIKLKPKKYELGPRLKEIIDGMRVGKVEDTRGWIHRVD